MNERVNKEKEIERFRVSSFGVNERERERERMSLYVNELSIKRKRLKDE